VIPSAGVGVFNSLTATTASIPTLTSTSILSGSISSGSITSGVYNGIQTSTISPSATAVEVGLGGATIGILLSTPDASRFALGQSVLIVGNSNAVFNNRTFVITSIGLPNVLNTNNPYSIPQLTVGSGGTVSAGTITTQDLTATNLNGKLNVVGATNNSGNLVLCNNTTNLTGNYDLLTDSNQHLKFTSTNNVLTVGGATNGSIVVPSTAGFITAPTLNGGIVSITGSGTNVRIGSNSLVSAGGANNMSIGVNNGRTAGTGGNNLIYGMLIGQAMTSASDNAIFGLNSCNSMTTGIDNCVFGISSGTNLTTGFSDTLIGRSAGTSITTGIGNTLIGRNAGNTITIGDWNTAIGERALHNVLGNANTGIYNVALGHYTCPQLTSANYNTSVGSFAGTFLTTGTYNIYIGYNSLASGAGNSNGEYVIGDSITGKGSNSAIIKMGDNNFWLSGYGSGTLTTSASGQVIRVSDRNLKNNITYLSNAGSTSRILALKPCTYELKQDDIPHTYKGFIAQDVMEILPSAVDGKKHRFQFEKNVDGSPKRDEEGNIIYMKDENGNPLPRYLGLNTTDILAEAVLAIQEQQTEITDLKAQLQEQQKQIDELKLLVEKLLNK